jgi:sporulation protein YlmC with PRC-barrel domain
MKRPTVLATVAMLWVVAGFASPASDAADTGQTWRLTELLDQPVMNMQDEELGEIDDVVIRRNGKVKQAIISLGGPLGLNGDDTGVRFRALKLGSKGSVRLDATAEELENKPRFNYRQSDLFSGYYSRPLPPAYGRGMRGSDPRRYTPYPGREGPPDYRFYPGPGPYFPYFYSPWYGSRGYHPMNWTHFPARMLGSSLIDRQLLNKSDEGVGSLEDLIIDSNHQVTQFLVSTGDFLGIGGKVVAIPYRPLGFTLEGVVYDITAEQLESLPAYEK